MSLSQNCEYDKDLRSIQEARTLLKKAKEAQKELDELSQEAINNVVEHIARGMNNQSELLAKMAVDETGYGNVADKTFKNHFASMSVYEYIKDMKTHGIIGVDDEKKIWDIGVALGVVVGLIPSTNPTSTVIYKTLICLKSGNAIVFSPHPAAVKCITKTVELIKGYLEECCINPDLVGVLELPTIEGTSTLMKSDDTSMILATGGKAMVKSAYSSGTPALGVGPGNVPAFIERSADIKDAVSKIIAGKTFDNGVICASEQSVVVEDCIRDKAVEEFKKQGCYFLNDSEKKALEVVIQKPGGGVNPGIVGKLPVHIAKMAGLTIPDDTKIIIAFETGVGKAYPFSLEKLSPILAFYTEPDWEKACEKCIEILNYGGIGHSLSMHSKNMDVIREFALKKPVSRLLVNTPATHGAIGASTSLAPSLTLGCGAVGGSATSDNVTPLNLINIRRVAFGLDQTSNIELNGEDEIRDIVKRVIAQMNL